MRVGKNWTVTVSDHIALRFELSGATPALAADTLNPKQTNIFSQNTLAEQMVSKSVAF